MPHFVINPNFLASCSQLFDISIYSNGDVIIQEGDHDMRIYWILQGACRLTKRIPFIKRAGRAESILYEEGAQLQEGDEIVYVDLKIQEMDMWDHFPGLSQQALRVKEMQSIDPERAENMMKGWLGNTEVNPSVAEYSVIASARTEVASLLRTDYIRYSDETMLLETVGHKNLFAVSNKEVREAFEESKKWDSYKKNVLGKQKKN